MVKNIAVMGGAGFIGSHTAKELNRQGYCVFVFDNLSRGFESACRFGPFFNGDLANPQDLDRFFTEHQIDAVLHFAAFAYVGESSERPDLYYSNNVTCTIHLLDAMHRAGIKNLIFSSSCATFGNPPKQPISEDTPQQPINPYGHSKLMVEQILRDYAKAFLINSVSLRYFNAAGSDPEGEIGENHEPEPHIIPRILMAAKGIIPEIKIFGNDYPTPDHTCVRDYIHVCDLAEAHILALRYLEKESGAHFFNLGNGNGYSNLELVQCAEQVTQRPINYSFAPRRPGDPPILVGDSSRARKLLNWQPQYASLQDMIRHSWDWMQKRTFHETQQT
jgi:UDP-glucose-4-epimerase GalE